MICCLRIGIVTWVALLSPAVSSTMAIASGIENASPADGALGDSVWYDADREAVVPVHARPIVDDSLNRDSRWLPQAQRVQQPPTPSNAGGAGAGLFGSGLTISNLLGWLLLIAILAAAVGIFAYALSKTEVNINGNGKYRSGQLSNLPDEQTIERMKHLPAELRRTDVNLRFEAERLMNEGQYDQAIILLFGHQLLLLDRIGMLRLNRGKTNRKYVRETAAVKADAARRLQGTVTAFERSYFGRHVITQREFAELWRSNGELEQAADLHRETAA